MKRNFFTTCVGVIALTVCLSTNLVFAGKGSALDQVKQTLKAATPVEMPAKASQLVSQAEPKNRETMAESVVMATHAVRPVALIAVVSAVSRENSDVAPATAARAAALQPKDAAAMARAAAGAAPKQAAKIVYAVCKAAPTKYSQIAVAVAQVAPEAGKEIVAAVAEAVPALKPFVDRASTGGSLASVGSIMAQTEGLVKATAQASKTTPEKLITTPVMASTSPVFALPPPSPPGPAYHPLPGTPAEVNVTNTIEVPPGGGRDYSGP